MSKYKSKKTVVDGIEFDSKKEANRWQELRLMEESGEITHLTRQVEFLLIPKQMEPDTIGARGRMKRGKIIERECVYIADFVYYDSNNKFVVEDTKGVRTDAYRIKRKLMLYMHGIRIKET